MADIDKKLETLYDLLVDNLGILEEELIDLISKPHEIKNTNKFASLLSNLKHVTFINPLLLQISLSEKDDPWLTDFLHAVINLLNESFTNDEFDSPPTLIDKLQTWILDNQGEIAWKAAGLLKFYESELVEKIRLKKLEERGDFFLTYMECILGLLRYDKSKYMILVEQLAKDETVTERLREFCINTIQEYR